MNPQRPFSPARCPVFYGWVVLVAGVFGMLMSIPGQTMGVSVFSDHLLEATGLSRVALSNAYLVGTLASGLLLPFGGRLLDRYGARVTAIASCFVLAFALLALSRVDHLSARMAGLLGVSSSGAVTLIVLALAFSVLRFSGQGMLTLSSRNMVPTWFDRRRGIASGLSSVFVTFGFSFAPVVLAAWIEAAGGWREAWVGMAACVGVGMSLIAWVFYRDNPEECGLVMDGAAPAPDSPRAAQAARERRALPLGLALRTGAFWAVTLGLSIHAAVVTGVVFHIVDIGAEVGLTAKRSVALFPPIAVISVTAALTSGAAADRFRLRGLVSVLLIGELAGCVGWARLGEPVFLGLAIVGTGIASGLFGTLSTLAMAKLFGRAHLGTTSSAQTSALVIGSALGPSLLAASRQAADSYDPALLAAAALPILVLVVTLASKDPVESGEVW